MGALSLSPERPSVEFRLPPRARWSTRVALGTHISNARVAAGMTQTQLAAGATSSAYLSRIEASERRPSRKLMAELVSRLQVNSDDILSVESHAHEGLHLELAHADLLLGSGYYDDAARVVGDLAEVAAGIRLEGIADAARVVQATTLLASGCVRAALKIALPLTDGPMGLTALVAVARAHLELREYRHAIAVGHQIRSRLAAHGRLSAPELANIAVTVCEASRAIGRDSAAEQVARLALRHLPADMRARTAVDNGPLLEPTALSYESFGHVVRDTERTVASLQFDRLSVAIEELHDHASSISHDLIDPVRVRPASGQTLTEKS